MITLLAAKNTKTTSNTEKGKGLVWQTGKSEGTYDENLKLASVEAGGNVAVNAGGGVSVDIKREEVSYEKCDGFGNCRTETRKEALERLVKEDPGFAWMLTLEEKGQLTLNKQEEAHDEWSYDNSGLTGGRS